jgi:hypothetical protein
MASLCLHFVFEWQRESVSQREFKYPRKSLLMDEGLFKHQLRDCEYRAGGFVVDTAMLAF